MLDLMGQRCNWFGVASMTPSGLSRTNSSASDEYSGTENFAATSAAAGNGSTMAARVADGFASISSMCR